VRVRVFACVCVSERARGSSAGRGGGRGGVERTNAPAWKRERTRRVGNSNSKYTAIIGSKEAAPTLCAAHHCQRLRTSRGRRPEYYPQLLIRELLFLSLFPSLAEAAALPSAACLFPFPGEDYARLHFAMARDFSQPRSRFSDRPNGVRLGKFGPVGFILRLGHDFYLLSPSPIPTPPPPPPPPCRALTRDSTRRL
jgi:hypothetical protein